MTLRKKSKKKIIQISLQMKIINLFKIQKQIRIKKKIPTHN